MPRRASRLLWSRGRRLEQCLSVSDRAWWKREREERRGRIGLGDVIEEVWLREDWRLGLCKFEHVGVEVADGFLIGKVTGMRWYDCGIYMSLCRWVDVGFLYVYDIGVH
jgi:hypothetical protein